MPNILDTVLEELQHLRSSVARMEQLLATPAQPAPEEDRFIGTREAAALMGRKQDWVRDNIGTIPHSRIPGGQLQFSTLELKAWMEQRFEAGRVPTAHESAANAMRGGLRHRAPRHVGAKRSVIKS